MNVLTSHGYNRLGRSFLVSLFVLPLLCMQHLMDGMLFPLLFIAHDDYKQQKKRRKYLVFVTGSNRMHKMWIFIWALFIVVKKFFISIARRDIYMQRRNKLAQRACLIIWFDYLGLGHKIVAHPFKFLNKQVWQPSKAPLKKWKFLPCKWCDCAQFGVEY